MSPKSNDSGQASDRVKKLSPLIKAQWEKKLADDRARKEQILKIPEADRSIDDSSELDAINARELALALGIIDIPEEGSK